MSVKPSRLRIALLAGVALTAASGAVVHATSAAPLEPVAIERAVTTVEHDDADRTAPAKSRGWAIYAAGAAALALIARLIGWRRVAAGAKAAATATAGAARAAGRAAARVLASPFRAAVALVSLGLIGFIGVGLYDVEWLAGMAFGAIIAVAAILGANRARRAVGFRRPAGGR